MSTATKFCTGAIFYGLSLLFSYSTAIAQPGPLTSLGLRDAVYDRIGNTYQLQDLAVNDTVRGYDTLIINQTCDCDAGYFRLYFEPGCGMDDTTVSADTLRRNVLCRVLRDLSAFIQSPLTSSGEKVNIWVRNKDNVPGASATTAFGTSFYPIPAINSVSGIVDNTTWLTIHSGVDGYTNIAGINPWLISTSNATYFHAIIAFDFDTYTWHTDLSSSPSSGDYDEYSVALREIARILGITSAIKGDGNSVLGSNYPYFTRYDKYLKTHDGIPLLSHTGSNAMYGYQWNSALNVPGNVLSPYSSSCVDDSTVCDTAVQYDGAVTIPTYTPNCFELGYSLGNFEDMCTGTPDPANNNLYFTVSNVTFPGTLKRYLQTEERTVLCDIGYNVDTVYGDTSILNYEHYGSTVCNGITVAGIHDGFNSSGASVYYSSSDGKIRFNGPSLVSGIPGLLDNDVNADAFEGLEVLNGSGTLNATSGGTSTDIYYTPASGDGNFIIVRYVPLNTSSGQRGNVTYAELLMSRDPACDVTPCNLVQNGEFEFGNNAGVLNVVPSQNRFFPSTATAPVASLCNWLCFLNSADWYRDGFEATYMYGETEWRSGIPFPPATGTVPAIDVFDRFGTESQNFIGMSAQRNAGGCSSGGTRFGNEAIQTQLTERLIPGARYKLEFWARVLYRSGWNYHNCRIQVHVSDGPPAFPPGSFPPSCGPAAYKKWPIGWAGLPFTNLTAAVGGYSVAADMPATLNQWHHIEDEFTYTGTALPPGASQFIILSVDPNQTAIADTIVGDFRVYAFIADFRITPLIEEYPPITVCSGASFNLYPDSVKMDAGYDSMLRFDAFTWEPSGSVTCTTPPCPFPTATVTGTTVFTVTETFYDCVRFDTVNIFDSMTIVVSADTACSNDTLHLGSVVTTGDGPFTYSWSGPLSFTSTDANPTRTPPKAGVYTLTVTDAHSCTKTTTINVVVNPAPGPFSGDLEICVGQLGDIDNTAVGGTWSTSDPDISLNPTTGAVTGVSAGTAIVTYGFGPDCMATVEVTVNPLPDPISGTLTLCAGGGMTTLSDAILGGTWSSSNPLVASIDASGVVTGGLLAGTATITYTLSTGCYVTVVVTVNPLPTPISGVSALCVGATAPMGSTPPGGMWSASPTAVATIDGSGILTGASAGTVVVTYTRSNGCYRTKIVTVHPLPDPITGDSLICIGTTTTLSDATPDGTWSSGSLEATVDPSGVVTGVAAGTAMITYTITATGCYDTAVVTVIDTPIIGPIYGFDTVCIGDTTVFYDTTMDGIWASGGTGIATVDLSGSGTGYDSTIIVGMAAGTTLISYTVTGECGDITVTRQITVIGLPDVSISGILGVCSTYTTELTGSPGGGTWESSDPSIASIDASGVVTGIVAGSSVTITYTVTNMCGSSSNTVNVLVNMEPYITTNFVVACQVKDVEAPLPVISESTECTGVCEHSKVWYYANGVAGSDFTWTVLGGTILIDDNDSILVEWGSAGLTGYIAIHDTFEHCIDSAMACIQIIAKPDANFSTLATSFCLDADVHFTDLSTFDPASPIISWYWNFGDGHSSAAQHPTHAYSDPGIYTVTLVVTNACNCTDSFTMEIEILDEHGPDIECPSVMCDSGIATYSTSECGGPYAWTVTGGTIISPTGTNTITVKWDAIGPDGFGYVSLDAGCATCSLTTTIKVPVIPQNPSITGPSVVCQGKQYEYNLPLWPATQYRWGVLEHPEMVIGCREDNKVTLSFHSVGVYTVHTWYQNKLALCGAAVTTTVNVLPSVSITGPLKVCAGETHTYNLPGGLLGDWEIRNPMDVVVGSGSSSSSFNHTFSTVTPGIYKLTATGDFCADPLTIVVYPLPPAIDSVKGEDTICLGRVYNYRAYNFAPGSIYSWEAEGGTVIPSSGTDKVSVKWTDSGPKFLKVRRVGVMPPYCEGPQWSMTIYQEIIDPNITGDITPCANSNRIYNSHYTRGEDYVWTILPNTAGSIVTGNHTSVAKVLWNNVTSSTPAAVIVSVMKCDSIINDTLDVNLIPMPALTITPSVDTACPGEGVTFTATSGGAIYSWDYGDGTLGDVTTSPVSPAHAFPQNATTGNASYIVRVYVTPDPLASCPISGIATYTMIIRPGPVAHAIADAYTYLCGSFTLSLYGTVTSNVTGPTYQWYKDGSPVGTGSTLSASAYGTYKFLVTSDNGCSAWSNSINLVEICAPTTGGSSGGDTILDPCDFVPTASKATDCNTIYLYGDPGAFSINWVADTDPGPGGSFTVTLPDAVAVYDTPGIYRFTYWAAVDGEGCVADTIITDTIHIVPRIGYTMECAGGGYDSVFLYDHSYYLPWVTVTSVDWEVDGVYVGTGSTLGISLAAGGSYVIKETVNWSVGGSSYSCEVTRIITTPDVPHASFTLATSPICESIPISFTDASTGAVGYHWDFGDGAELLLMDADRAYTWAGPSNPEGHTVTLTVRDAIGCTDDTTRSVSVFHNVLDGDLGSDETFCEDGVPVTLTWFGLAGTPIRYEWSSGDTTTVGFTTVSESGAYWVTVKDIRQCQRTLPEAAKNVTILHVPDAKIYGVQHYCKGDAVELFGYAGDGVDYEWFRDGVSISTDPAISDGGLLPGTYHYKLVLSVSDPSVPITCTDTSILDTVRIYDLPDTPTVALEIVDCDLYHLQLIASSSVSGSFHWRDGAYGPVNDITDGGMYRVTFTDLHGCSASRDKYVPLSPEYYFQYFPTGCFDICEGRLPLTLYGPPCVPFEEWDWLKDGTSVLGGVDDTMEAYDVTDAGTYQWQLKTICEQTSDPLKLSVTQCEGCQAMLSASFTCDSSTPKSYSASITFGHWAPGTASFLLGTDIGPLTPFSGTVSSTGMFTLPFTFTTLEFDPLPDSVTVELVLTLADGTVCYNRVRVPLPPCGWVMERAGGSGQATQPDKNPNGDARLHIASAMMVFPNPAASEITVSYDYGNEGEHSRLLTVYDAMGRKMGHTIPADTHGAWKVDISGWASGIYIVRMEGDGKALQTQRIVVTH